MGAAKEKTPDIEGQLFTPKIFHKVKEKRLEFASMKSRWVAAFIDGFLVSIMAGILKILIVFSQPLLGPDITQLLATFISPTIYINYYVIPMVLSGQTFGKKKMGIKVVNDETGKTVLSGQALIREMLLKPVSLGILIGAIMPFFNKKAQSLHDILAKTVVIKSSK